ncbi:MAG: oligosaccharide flippase family protein [Candidatus Odinarchaeia archaeon]
MAEYREFAKNIGIAAVGQLLVSLGGIVLLPILTKSLGAGDYGLWVQVEVTVSLLTTVAGLGLPYALNRFLASEKDQEKIKDIFYSTLIFTLTSTICLSTLLFVFSYDLANLFFAGNIEVVLLTLLLAPIRAVWWVYLNYLRAFREMDKYAFVTVLQKYGVVGLVTLLIFLGYNLIGAVSSLLIVYTLTLLILIYLVTKRIGFKKPAFIGLKHHLRFSLPTVLSNISSWVVNLSDRYVIAALLGAIALGYYSSAYVVGSLAVFVTSLLSLLLPSTLSKLYDEGKIRELKNHMSYSLKFFLMISIPFIFGNMALSKPILTVLSTPEIANYSYLVAVIIAAGIMFYGVHVVNAQILVVVKKTEINAFTWCVSGLANLALAIPLVLFIGVIGAAIATLVSFLIASTLTTYFSFKHIRFRIDVKFIIKCVASSIIMYLILSLFSPVGAIQTVLVMMLGVAIYFAVMIISKGFRKEEIDFIKSLFKSIKR